MADRQQDLDANEPATAHKLEKARERGSIVRSNEVTFAAVLVASVASVYGLAEQALKSVSSVLGHALPLVGRGQLSSSTLLAFVERLGTQAALAVAPIVFVIWMTALAVSVLQARGVFSSKPLGPDFTRLNPATGIKRVFSLRSIQELGRSFIKIALSVLAMVVWAQQRATDIVEMADRSPSGMLHKGLDLAGSALTVLAALTLLFALMDWTFNKWDYNRKMRMSRRDIKDEHKEREGDPRIKARLRELRIEWLKRMRQLSKVRSADVLLVNPTHYAVALEYRSADMPAPKITARGAGDLAQRMRIEARNRNVPIVENAPLTRALFATHESELFVPREHFESVARILRWVYAARGQRESRGVNA